MFIGMHVCIYIFMNVTHAPWPLLELEVVHSAPVQLTINYLEDNLSSSLAAAFVVCHCTGTDSAQTVPGRNRERAFSGKSLWLLCSQNQPQTWGVSLLKEWDGTEHWVDTTGFVVLRDRLGLIARGREVWSFNLTQENIFFACSLNYSSRKEGPAQNVAEFSWLHCLQSFCSGSKTELPFLVCRWWRFLRSVHAMLVYPARISIFWPLIRGSHSFPSAQLTSSVARLER